MTFAEKLSLAIRDAKISQKDLAERCGLAQSRISKWIGETGSPNPDQLGRLAKVLRKPVQWFCYPEIEEPADVPEPGGDPEWARVWEVAKALGVAESYQRLILAPAASAQPDRGQHKNPPDRAEGGGFRRALGASIRSGKPPKGGTGPR